MTEKQQARLDSEHAKSEAEAEYELPDRSPRSSSDLGPVTMSTAYAEPTFPKGQ
ncbi:hypothetical protein [Streptomyces tsukubensis]|uniref:hypothetical protein n=1 Tax=Streptomyces tsukubensis TaxID=83656 RepID=UPI0015C30048|nr:hypothetical protein [Streptomyces tsukubensis]